MCGNPALDFAATLRARRSVRFEMFAAPDRLDAWYLESGIVDAVTPSGESEVEEAIAVREAVYELVTARVAGDAYDKTALAVMNNAARKPPVTPSSPRRGDGPTRHRSRRCPRWRGTPSSC